MDWVWKFIEENVIPYSNCLKANIGTAIVKDGKLISVGWNSCSPVYDGEKAKYGEKLEKCPRMDVPSGTGYELCSPVHSEVMAILNLRSIKPTQNELSRFASYKLERIIKTIKEKVGNDAAKKPIRILLEKYMKGDYLRVVYPEVEIDGREEYEKLKLLENAHAYVVFHYWVCETCETVLKAAGVNSITLNKEMGEKIRKEYEKRKLTGMEDNL